MADCTSFIQTIIAAGQLATLNPLDHNVLTPVAFSRTTCASYVMTFPAFTVVDFTVQVTPDPTTAFSYDVKFYRVVGNVLTPIATATSADQGAVFSKEFAQGTYVVCFQTSSQVSLVGSALAVYRGYQRFAVLDAFMHTGQSMVFDFDRSRKPQDCSAVLLYEVIEGSLPPGIRMTGLGQVLGVAPNLDCVDDNVTLPPSQNWSFQHNDGSFHPRGRQWRFKVRVMIDGMPDVTAEEWFCVKVHNNWSIDRDNFLAQAPFQVEVQEATVHQPVVIPELCPQPAPVVAWKPVAIPHLCEDDPRAHLELAPIVPQCETCGGREEVVQTIPIPFGVPSINPLYVKSWWDEVKDLAISSFEFKEFVRRMEGSPVFQKFLQDQPVQVTEERRTVVLRTFTDDPNILFWKWRREEAMRLPMGAEVVCGESVSINITDGNRT